MAEGSMGTELPHIFYQLELAASKREVRQLKLAARCVGITPGMLDKVESISSLYSSLEKAYEKDDAISILYLFLLEVKMKAETVRKLPVKQESFENWKQKKEMKFALMVIDICNQIAGEDCKRFIDLWKGDIPETSEDIETLFKYLFQHRKVWLEDVERLKQVLESMGNQVCLDIVENYQCFIKSLRQENPQGQLRGEDTVKPGNKADETGQGNLYCLKQLTCAQELVIKRLSPHDLRAGGEVPLDKIWDMTQINGPLKVYLLNPEVLDAEDEKWMSQGDRLTWSLILSWATMWNANAKHYPKISDEIPKQDEAQIRVRLSTSEGCWSYVGRDAETEDDKNEPTMVLNLYNVRQPTQRNLVIHEFGHALGLGHEHQRSDFWAILGEKDKSGEYCFIDMKKMEDSVGIDHVHTFTELSQSGKLVRSKYDPQSIMHYWFDVGWLKEEYHNRRNIKYNDALSEEEKDVLEGIHQRDHKNGACRLPGRPSQTDYDTLNEAYMPGL